MRAGRALQDAPNPQPGPHALSVYQRRRQQQEVRYGLTLKGARLIQGPRYELTPSGASLLERLGQRS